MRVIVLVSFTIILVYFSYQENAIPTNKRKFHSGTFWIFTSYGYREIAANRIDFLLNTSRKHWLVQTAK